MLKKLGVVVLCTFGFIQAALSDGSLESWLEQQSRISQQKIIQNISQSGTAQGVVVASPSRNNPNYYFHWVRDAALVMQQVISFKNSQSRLLNFAQFSWTNQLSEAQGGLGEPKFYVDGRVYNEPWGRPQNDGPALRAITLISFANKLLDENKQRVVEKYLYNKALPAQSVIKGDLEYISHEWQNPCVDLWEERWGNHFYTEMVQRKALVEGAKLARRLNDEGAARWYEKQAQALQEELSKFKSEEKGIIIPTRNGNDSRASQLDTSIILAVLHGHTDDGFFAKQDEWVLSTADKLEKAFEVAYRINDGKFPGMAIGRYPEDVYYGGNPWYLTTIAFAEFYFRLATAFSQDDKILITKLNSNFFNSLFRYENIRGPYLSAGAILIRKDPRYDEILNLLKWKGDNYLRRVRMHTPANGSFSEQFSRLDGHQVSAYDLTWSFASFLSTIKARNDFLSQR